MECWVSKCNHYSRDSGHKQQQLLRFNCDNQYNDERQYQSLAANVSPHQSLKGIVPYQKSEDPNGPYFPSASMALASSHGILLPPKPVGSC